MATTEATTGTDYTLGFTSQDEETMVDRLPVTGELPAWLTGALVRVTPALLEVGGKRLAHWFDGLAMLNRFGFADGRVSYGSRFLESRAYEDAKEGEWRHGGFATDPCRSIFKRVQQVFSPDVTDNPNVNLARIGERYIAMTETPMPVEFDPETLDTIGHLDYADKLKAHVTTAHPHHDAGRDELVNYVARFSRVSEYVLYGMPAGSTERRVIARMPVKEPAYMHAFGMSERYLILAEYPLRVNPLKLAFSGRPFIENYSWRRRRADPLPGLRPRDRRAARHLRDGRVLLLPPRERVRARRRARDRPVRVRGLEHHRLALPRRERPARRDPARPSCAATRSTSTAGRCAPSRSRTGSLELPRIDYGRRNTRDYSYAYFTGADTGWIDRLVKVDVRDGSRSEWRADGCYPGEPVFVREPGAEAEDAGVVLSVVLDANAGRSFLLVLDAGSFEELARADAPHHIPFGFHGQYFR